MQQTTARKPRRVARRSLTAVCAGLLGAVALMVAAAQPGQAAETTPAHVYRVVETVGQEVALLHREDMTGFETPAPGEPRARRPRHVLQKARTVFGAVQSLRFLNGLSVHALDPEPVRRIEPRDVRLIVDRILEDVRGLRRFYGIEGDTEPPPLREGMTPTDVYARLQVLETQVRALGLPAVVPNDVYRAAQMLREDVATIAAFRDVGPLSAESEVTGKAPADVYELARGLLVDLGRLAEVERFAVPGGVQVPVRPTAAIRPSHVLAMMRSTLAELNAMKVTLGITTPVRRPPQPAGRTPSDVFAVLHDARTMIQNLIASADVRG